MIYWKAIRACALVALVGACSQKLTKLPEVTFVADFGSPENAAIQVKALSDRTELDLRDTMVGLDGYDNFLLGNEDAVVLMAPRFDCPRPNSATYLMEVSITPESPWGDAPMATGELIRKQLSTAIRDEEDLPSCQP